MAVNLHAKPAAPAPANRAAATKLQAFSWRELVARLGTALPGVCALCARTGAHVLCSGCRLQYFGQTHPRCRCCGLPLSGTEPQPALCGQCLRQPPAFDATVVAADYAAPIDQLVLELKFGARLALAPLFADLLGQAVLAVLAAQPDGALSATLPDYLIPVPLGALRLQQRGFNQALEIARPLATALGLAIAPRLLVRTRETAAQARLPPRERRLNLRGAFTLTPASLKQVRGCHVGVVDDVMTTGQTLHEIAATLKRFGAARVTNLVFARTLPK